MRLKIDVPKEQPKMSLDIEVDEAKVKEGIAKLYHFLRNKLPIGVKVESGQNQGKHQD